MSALVEALVAAQAELPCAIGKDAEGQIGTRKYGYLTLDKLIAETRPILQKHGIVITQWPAYEVVYGGNEQASTMRPTLVTRVEHASSDGRLHGGDALEYRMPLYVDPPTMQGLGAAITYARRYAWQAVLGIAAEEDTDAAEVQF